VFREILLSLLYCSVSLTFCCLSCIVLLPFHSAVYCIVLFTYCYLSCIVLLPLHSAVSCIVLFTYCYLSCIVIFLDINLLSLTRDKNPENLAVHLDSN
jgi:hypothetical protein